MSKFDMKNVKTCTNAFSVCVGDYGIFADNIGRLKKAVMMGNKGCTGYVKWVENEDSEYRFTDEYDDSYTLFYPLEGAK